MIETPKQLLRFDPIPAYLVECERLKVAPRAAVIQLLESLWQRYLKYYAGGVKADGID